MNTYFYRTDPTKYSIENFQDFFRQIFSFPVHVPCSLSRFGNIPQDYNFEPDLQVCLSADKRD